MRSEWTTRPLEKLTDNFDSMRIPAKDADLGATVFRHLDIPLDAQWTNPQGRPIPIVAGTGAPVPELV